MEPSSIAYALEAVTPLALEVAVDSFVVAAFEDEDFFEPFFLEVLLEEDALLEDVSGLRLARGAFEEDDLEALLEEELEVELADLPITELLLLSDEEALAFSASLP